MAVHRTRIPDLPDLAYPSDLPILPVWTHHPSPAVRPEAGRLIPSEIQDSGWEHVCYYLSMVRITIVWYIIVAQVCSSIL